MFIALGVVVCALLSISIVVIAFAVAHEIAPPIEKMIYQKYLELSGQIRLY